MVYRFSPKVNASLKVLAKAAPQNKPYISVEESCVITAECKHGYDVWLAVNAWTLM